MMDAILQQLNIAFCFFDFENSPASVERPERRSGE